ncbi:hypothetical protein [Allobranchiibius sp. GilTou73]|uniref:hypothetical protein n=1 Tax=Allobranchiibius sp. GilTou73 TaxID=2904523 RepID=UPI001F3C4051|nr:hypothetical protein [Allobranchiibius sp. GilTou73]UIJ35070.1 hypothetical protein LVQ62_01255 [Allobranchiibius sp. GilTou73]
MTTVDFSVEGQADGGSLSFHNEMWGPATALLYQAVELARSGVVDAPTWNVAEVTGTIRGGDLHCLLDALDDSDFAGYEGTVKREDVELFLAAARPAEVYRISGFEV